MCDFLCLEATRWKWNVNTKFHFFVFLLILSDALIQIYSCSARDQMMTTFFGSVTQRGRCFTFEKKIYLRIYRKYFDPLRPDHQQMCILVQLFFFWPLLNSFKKMLIDYMSQKHLNIDITWIHLFVDHLIGALSTIGFVLQFDQVDLLYNG